MRILTRAEYNEFLRGAVLGSEVEQSNQIASAIKLKLDALTIEKKSLKLLIKAEKNEINLEIQNVRERVLRNFVAEQPDFFLIESLNRINQLRRLIHSNKNELNQVCQIIDRFKNMYIEFLELPD
jgi:hypothetical protein